jgi:putative ABC transport system permease protein
MRFISHALALSAAAIRGIPERLGTSLVTIISITTVMGVLVTMLALGEGIEFLSQNGVRTDRATVLASGAQSAMVSSLPRTAFASIADKPGIKRDAEGKPLATGVVLMVIDAVTTRNQRSGIGLWAAGAPWQKIFPELRVVEGRLFEPGLHELIVSERVRDRLKGMNVGDSVPVRGNPWKIVGVYHSTSSFFDNAVIADVETVLAAFPQSTYTSVTVVLDSASGFATLKKAVAADPTLSADVKTEAEANEAVTKGLRNVLDFVSYFIGSLMGLGAVCGALSSLYAAVEMRTGEIATLRALGFTSSPVVVSVLAEGMVLAVPAALLGAAIAWYLFNGHVVIANGVTFPMAVTPHLVWVSLAWALSIALIGGILPSIRAARMSVANAMRAT